MAIPALIAMLKSNKEVDGGVYNAMAALRVICAAPDGRDAAVSAGVPAAVTAAMATCDARARSNAAVVLSNMSACFRARVVAAPHACFCFFQMRERLARACRTARFRRATDTTVRV